MRSSSDISNVEFQKVVSGYRPSDVQQYLLEVAEDYGKLQSRVAELEAANATQAKEIIALKEDQGSVHNLLFGAQRLADNTIENAKIEANKIINEANATVKQIMSEAEARVASAKQHADEIKKNSDIEMQKLLSKAVAESENMITAAHDSVARQQLLFDKLKVESAAFKKELEEVYKKHFELLNSIPDEVPFDAQRAADAIAFEADKSPNFKEMAVNHTNESAEAPIQTEAAPAPKPEPSVFTAPATNLVKQQQATAVSTASSISVESAAEPVQKPLPKEEIVSAPMLEQTEFNMGNVGGADINQSDAQEKKKKSPFFGGIKFTEDDDDEDFEPRDLFGRKK